MPVKWYSGSINDFFYFEPHDYVSYLFLMHFFSYIHTVFLKKYLNNNNRESEICKHHGKIHYCRSTLI